MKIYRIADNLTNLEKSQMLKIDELQEKIKLLEFDKSKNNSLISKLKRKRKSRCSCLKKVIRELELMKKENNYKRIDYVIKLLNLTTMEIEDD